MPRTRHSEPTNRCVGEKHTDLNCSASSLVVQPCLNHLGKTNTVYDLGRDRGRRLNFFLVQSHCGDKRSGDEDGGIPPLFLLVVAGFCLLMLRTPIAGRRPSLEHIIRALVKCSPAPGTADNHWMRWGRFRLVRIGVLALRIDSTTGDRASALLAHHHPGIR